MAKINPPLRTTKAVTGYKNRQPMRGSTNEYDFTTNAGATEAVVTNRTHDEVESFTGTGLKDIINQIKAFVGTLGVKFTMSPAQGPAETQLLVFEQEPNYGRGRIYYSTTDDDSAQWYVDQLDAATLQTRIQGVDGLEDVTVTGTLATGFTITMTNATEPVALLEVISSDPDYTFSILTDVTYEFTASAIADAGTFRIDMSSVGGLNGFQGSTAEIPYGASNTTTQNAIIAAFPELSGVVTVSGDFTSVTPVVEIVFDDTVLTEMSHTSIQVVSSMTDAGSNPVSVTGERTGTGTPVVITVS